MFRLYLVFQYARPPVSTLPEGALRTPFAFGIINAFLMRTANNSIGYGHGLGRVFPDERKGFLKGLFLIPVIFLSMQGLEQPRQDLCGKCPLPHPAQARSDV